MEMIFWLSLAFVAYTYFGYPLLIKTLSKLIQKPVNKGFDKEDLPKVSVVIAARNEANNIQNKLLNLSKQTYPFKKLEIIVVSDGSDDNTNDIIQQWVGSDDVNQPAVKLVQYDERQGKPHAVNIGVNEAGGEIVVLADARQTFKDDAVFQLVSNFNDPEVGCVSGELFLKENEESEINQEMGVYWKYEKFIRVTESKIGSVVGVTGSIYAIRKCLYQTMPKDTLLDDVYEPMSVVLQGYRVIFDETAQAVDVVSDNIAQEWKRKVRTLAGNWQLLNLGPRFFLPFSNNVWWKFWSHKVFRLLVPFNLLLLFISGMMQDGVFYLAVTLLQAFIYSIVFVARFSEGMRRNKLVSLGYFFMVLNAAIVVGFYYWVTGKSSKVWAPAYQKPSST